MTRQFNSAAHVGNQQKSKKARVDAYLNKEAFMKEALARHMAVEEARVQAALNPDAAAATDAGTSADVVAAAAAPAPVASIKPAPKTTPGGGKLALTKRQTADVARMLLALARCFAAAAAVATAAAVAAVAATSGSSSPGSLV